MVTVFVIAHEVGGISVLEHEGSILLLFLGEDLGERARVVVDVDLVAVVVSGASARRGEGKHQYLVTFLRHVERAAAERCDNKQENKQMSRIPRSAPAN